MGTTTTNEDVRRAFTKFVKGHIQKAFVGRVESNEEAEEKGIVQVFYNDLIYDVRLRSVEGPVDKGQLRVPAKDSLVFCVNEGNSENSYVVAADADLDKFRIGFGEQEGDPTASLVMEQGKAVYTTRDGNSETSVEMIPGTAKIAVKDGNNSTTVDISGGTITFNGGDNKGLVIVQPLKDTLSDIISCISTMHNALISAIGSCGSSAGAAAASETYASVLSSSISKLNSRKTTISKQLENKNIKH